MDDQSCTWNLTGVTPPPPFKTRGDGRMRPVERQMFTHKTYQSSCGESYVIINDNADIECPKCKKLVALRTQDFTLGDEEWRLLAEEGEKAHPDLLTKTEFVEEHPEEYDGPCLCHLCMSYGD